MHVGVGSGNPVKRRAVESALPGRGVPDRIEVEGVPIESGVADQPRGVAETIEGAENRARRALDAGAFDLGIGLEGGVSGVDGADGLYLIMWAAAADGERWGRGAGPTYRLPTRIEQRVRAGEELGPVMDDVLGEDDVAERQGAAGAFTAGRVDRESALAAAVAGALGPFVTDLYE